MNCKHEFRSVELLMSFVEECIHCERTKSDIERIENTPLELVLNPLEVAQLGGGYSGFVQLEFSGLKALLTEEDNALGACRIVPDEQLLAGIILCVLRGNNEINMDGISAMSFEKVAKNIAHALAENHVCGC